MQDETILARAILAVYTIALLAIAGVLMGDLVYKALDLGPLITWLLGTVTVAALLFVGAVGMWAIMHS